jgi:putative toxin-antitoxin system antitoxin component (TIGR02293 family)
MAISSILGRFIGVVPKSEFDLTRIVEEGISTESLQLLRDAGLTFTEVSEIIISPRTLKHRRSRGERLSTEEADRAVRVARILSLAENVFANRSKAFEWLRTSDDRFENRTPLSMLRTESGGRFVEEMLGQIDEGIYP